MDNKISQFMFNKVGFSNTKKFLDLASFRNKLIAGNIANSSTPGYKAKDIKFHEEFQKMAKTGNRLAGATTNSAHIPTGNHADKPPKIESEKIKVDEMNSVDIDKEIPNLVQNELMFTIGATLLQRKFEGLRKVINSR